MPLKLCNCDKEKLNEIIAQVKILSDTVDELREAINSMKICSIVSSKESLRENCESFRERRNKIGSSTFQRLKKCLENNFIPIIPMDAGYRVKKKCQQFFSPSPKTIVTCSGSSSFRQPPTRQHLPCPQRTNKDTRTLESCKNSKFNETRVARTRVKKTLPSTRKCQKEFCKNCKKTPIVSSASSTQSVKKVRDKTSKNARCSYEMCNVLHSSGKPEDKMRKKKTTGSVTSDLQTLVGDVTIEECTKNSLDSVKRRRSVNFVDKTKKSVAIDAKDSSTSSVLLTSNTSVDDVQRCKIIYKEDKRALRAQKKMKNESRKKKSKSAQCSSNCSYMKRPKSCPRDVSTNTLSQNFTKTQVCKKIVREKRQMCRETQTSSKSDENPEDFCFEERKRVWLCKGSLTSLTSCSPRSVSSFSLGMQKVNERFSKSCQEEEKFAKYRTFARKCNIEEPVNKKNNVNEANIFIPKRREVKIAQRKIESHSDSDDELKLTRNRQKRTYVISPDIPSSKIDESVQHNFHAKQKDFCSVTEYANEKNGTNSVCRRKWKKPEVTSKVCEVHNLQRSTCQSLPQEQENRYLKKTVCTNRPADNYFPKFSRWSRKKFKRSSRNDKVIRPQVCEYRSSSSRVLSNESCSLVSDSNLCEKSHAYSKNIKYPRNNWATKNEIKMCSRPETNAAQYTVCGSLSGSVRSISSRS